MKRLVVVMKTLGLTVLIFLALIALAYQEMIFPCFSSQGGDWKKGIMREIFEEMVGGRIGEISIHEAMEKTAELEELRKRYPNPKTLFSQLSEIYSHEIYLNTAEKNSHYSVHLDPHSHADGRERKYVYFDESGTIQVNANTYYQVNAIIKMADYYPIKGAFEAVLFLKKISDDPSAEPVIEELRLGPDNCSEYRTTCGSTTRGTQNVFPCVGYSFSKKLNLDPGCYAMQVWFHPNSLMARTLDGIIKTKPLIVKAKGELNDYGI